MQAQDLAGFRPGLEQLCLGRRGGGGGLGLGLRLLRTGGWAARGRPGGFLGEGGNLSRQVVEPIGDRLGIPNRILLLQVLQNGLSFPVFGQGRAGLTAGVQRIGLLDENVHLLIQVSRFIGSSGPQRHEQRQDDQARKPIKADLRPRSPGRPAQTDLMTALAHASQRSAVTGKWRY